MKKCCYNCIHLWEMEDWTDYPKYPYSRKVCGLFADEKFVMALYGDLSQERCEEYYPKKEKSIE